MTPVWFSSGVFENAFASPVVWLTALLSTWMAVLPSVTARALSVILRVHDKHKVRQAKVELSVCKPLRKKTRLAWCATMFGPSGEAFVHHVCIFPIIG